MTNAKHWTGWVAIILVIALAGCVSAQDWPQWRGANRNGTVSDFVGPDAPPTGLSLVWGTAIGTGDASPALVGDKLYVNTREGDEEVTRCLNVADGTPVWEERYAAAAAQGPGGSHPGPRSSPAVAEGKVVTLGVAGVLSCLDASTGALVWRKDPYPNTFPQFNTSTSPIIVDGLAIAHLGGAGEGALMAFELATGDVKWQWDGEGPEYASPTLLEIDGARHIVTATEKSVVGIDLADGALAWQLAYVPEGRSSNSPSPIVDGQTVIFTGSGRGMHAVNIEKQGDAYAPVDVWSNAEISCRFSTPVLNGGMLFGINDGGNLFCLNAGTGAVEWTGDAQVDRMGFGSLVDLGDAIVALPSSGELIAFAPMAGAYAELARFTVAETPTYAHPIVTGDGVFVKDEETVALWTYE
ncbi:MAG TPA: PQQ-binding-like beta-propeller repeat protein [Armatimonadota bacterium]|nr:PQQ-binding-like beta-propeller repeat protein [Armatimonadota bacterium]